MVIKLGNTDLTNKLYLGNNKVTKIYLGSTEIYSTAQELIPVVVNTTTIKLPAGTYSTTKPIMVYGEDGPSEEIVTYTYDDDVLFTPGGEYNCQLKNETTVIADGKPNSYLKVYGIQYSSSVPDTTYTTCVATQNVVLSPYASTPKDNILYAGIPEVRETYSLGKLESTVWFDHDIVKTYSGMTLNYQFLYENSLGNAFTYNNKLNVFQSGSRAYDMSAWLVDSGGNTLYTYTVTQPTSNTNFVYYKISFSDDSVPLPKAGQGIKIILLANRAITNTLTENYHTVLYKLTSPQYKTYNNTPIKLGIEQRTYLEQDYQEAWDLGYLHFKTNSNDFDYITKEEGG